MDGERGKVIKMEPAAARRVTKGGNGDHGRRIARLEARMTVVETVATEARDHAAVAKDNTVEILALAKAAKGLAGVAKKHGPRVMYAIGASGATAGAFNPKVAAFFAALFGTG